MFNKKLYKNKFHLEDLSKYKFLITGGAGFIGCNIVEYLLKNKAKHVRVLDNLSNGYLENIKEFLLLDNFEFIDGDIRESINVSGVNQLRLNLWQKMSQQSKTYRGEMTNIFLKILKYMFGPALMMIFVCEFILPGIFHGLLLSSFHLIQNAKMNTDNDYLKEFCTETRDIDPINFIPKLTFAYNKPWKWIGFFKFMGALVLGATAKIIIPKMTNVNSETWFYIGGSAMFMFLIMFVMMRMTTAKAREKLND